MPDDPPLHGLDDLYDIARLADRLGVEHATIRVWLSRRVPWLPRPDGRLNGGAVWRAETLVGLEERRRPGRPGPKPRPVVSLSPDVAPQMFTGGRLPARLEPPVVTGAVPAAEPAATTLTLPVVAPPAATHRGMPAVPAVPAALLPVQAEPPDGE